MRRWVACAALLPVLMLESTKPMETATLQLRLLDSSGRARLKNALTLTPESIAINRKLKQGKEKLRQGRNWLSVKRKKVQPHVDNIVHRWFIMQQKYRLYDVAAP